MTRTDDDRIDRAYEDKQEFKPLAYLLAKWREPWTLAKLRDTVGGICTLLLIVAAIALLFGVKP